MSSLSWLTPEHMPDINTFDEQSPLRQNSDNYTIQIVKQKFDTNLDKIRFCVEIGKDLVKFKIKFGVVDFESKKTLLLELGCFVGSEIGSNVEQYHFMTNSNLMYVVIDMSLDLIKGQLDIFLCEKFYQTLMVKNRDESHSFHAFVLTTDEFRVIPMVSPFDCRVPVAEDMILD